jgi:hypothetical protein
MRRTLNVRVLVASFAFIVFLAVALYAGIGQQWLVFFLGVVLTAVSASYALVAAEWWRTTRGGDAARRRRM